MQVNFTGFTVGGALASASDIRLKFKEKPLLDALYVIS